MQNSTPTTSLLFTDGPAGELGRGDQRGNEAERGQSLPELFRRSPEGHLHLDGERLLQTLPSLQADARTGPKLPSGERGKEKLQLAGRQSATSWRRLNCQEMGKARGRCRRLRLGGNVGAVCRWVKLEEL